MKRWLVGGGVVLLLALGLLVVLLPREGKDRAQHPTTALMSSPLSHSVAPTDVTMGPSPVPASPSDTELPTPLPRYERPVRNSQRAALIREALIAQQSQKLGAGTADRVNMPEPEGSGNQVGKPMGDYVNRMMQEQFVPMATECYATLLTKHPNVAGNVELEFSILGDASVGGVVVDVSLGRATTLTDPEFRTCMTESMFAVVFDPPPGDDGSVSVTQSFELLP